MTEIECFLCLETKKELANCIKIGSSEWNEHHVESVIEKHMWPMTSLKSKSSWLCCTCWSILHEFHDFYKRIKDSHDYYDYLVKSENDMEIDPYEVNDVPNLRVRPPDIILDEAEICVDGTDDNNIDGSINADSDKIKEHVTKKKPDAVQSETVILNDTLPGNSTLQLPIENDDVQEENPLELSTPNVDDDASNEQLRKQFLAKYYRFTCNICQDPCTTFAMLQEHFREVHNQEAYMICCGRKYRNRNVFGEHIKYHLDPDSFKCKYCSKILKNKRNLVHHIARWHEGNIFRCSVCNKKFLDKSKYNEHKSEHKEMLLDSDNENGDDEFFTAEYKRPTSSCNSDTEKEIDCNTLMTNSHKTAANIDETLHAPNSKRIDEHFMECYSYESDNSQGAEQKIPSTTTKSAETHQLTVQGYLSKTSKFKCDMCQEPCESFGELRQHFVEDHADQKPYVICCGMKYKSRNCLSEHVKSHLNPGCYQCEYCNKVLKNKRNFRAHIKTWHEEKTISCNKCEKRFVYKSEYEEHKSFNHLSETKIFERVKKVCNTNSSRRKRKSEGVSVNEDDDNNLHTTEDENNEMSLDDNQSLKETATFESKTSDTEFDNEKRLARGKTTPKEIMQFDKFLSQHHKFTCHLCDNPDELYDNFVTLRHHFSAAHNIEGYVMCCGVKFARRRCLVDHIKGHLDPNHFRCTYCPRVLRDRRCLTHHIAMHEGNVKRCDVCNKKFYDPIKYEDHKLTHIPKETVGEDDNVDGKPSEDCAGDGDGDSDDDIPLIHSIGKLKTKQDTSEAAETSKPGPDFTKNLQRQMENDEFLAKHFKMICPICEDSSKTFEAFALLRDHFVSHHNEDPYLICCGQKFKKRDTLVQHIKTHLNPNDFTCTFCSKILKSKRNLLYHIAACHEGKQFRCEICQKKFVEESSYKYHKNTHKPDDNPHFPCPECDRSYKIKHKLTHHINTTHRHRYARLCDICGTYFRDINLYNAHVKSKHQDSSTKEKYPCDICGRILTAKASLRLHKRTQHPESDSFPFTCHICSKPVATRGLLNYHIRMSHKNIKPHKCTICGKAYKEAKQLKGHMGIHTGESLYKCNFCSKTFNSTGNRSTHRKKCHPKEWEEWKKKFYIQTTTPDDNAMENT